MSKKSKAFTEVRNIIKNHVALRDATPEELEAAGVVKVPVKYLSEAEHTAMKAASPEEVVAITAGRQMGKTNMVYADAAKIDAARNAAEELPLQDAHVEEFQALAEETAKKIADEPVAVVEDQEHIEEVMDELLEKELEQEAPPKHAPVKHKAPMGKPVHKKKAKKK